MKLWLLILFSELVIGLLKLSVVVVIVWLIGKLVFVSVVEFNGEWFICICVFVK